MEDTRGVLWNFLSKNFFPTHTRIWEGKILSFKRDTSILSLKKIPAAICALSMIFLWYGPNQKYHSIKFYFKFSKEKTEFLDTSVYKEYNNRL